MLVFKPWKTGNIWGNADWDGRVRIDNDVILDPGVKDTDGTLWCEFRIEVQKSVIWTSEESSGLYTGGQYSSVWMWFSQFWNRILLL